jgi:hypothetical protein
MHYFIVLSDPTPPQAHRQSRPPTSSFCLLNENQKKKKQSENVLVHLVGSFSVPFLDVYNNFHLRMESFLVLKWVFVVSQNIPCSFLQQILLFFFFPFSNHKEVIF